MNAAPAAKQPDTFPQLIPPVRSGNVFEETLEKIATYITAGLLLPGEKLPTERELCQYLGVSRATIHEVITELKQLGYIQIHRGRYGGAYVIANSSSAKPKNYSPAAAKEIADLMDYRRILESAAAKQAALKSLSSREQEQLSQALAAVESAPDDAYRVLDSRLHLTIARLAAIPRLTQQLVEIRAEVNALLGQFPLLQRNIRNSDSQHRAMVEAILTGKAQQAEEIAAQHVAGTAALIRALA